MSNIKQKLGWRRPLPSPKPFKFAAPAGLTLPASVDLQPKCPPVYDQGNLGSCTANASAGLCEYVMKKCGHPAWTPSRLALYYWTRVAEGTNPSEDSGASVQDAIGTCHKIGVPKEALWWYNVAKFSVKPGKSVTLDAQKHVINQPLAINHFSLNDMQSCLAQDYPFVFGFSVYESFEQGNWDSTTGMMPMPKSNEQVLGGHAVMAVGYDNNKQVFKVRNSWGTGWGLSGYFWMPYKFIMSGDYADDFWTVHNWDVWVLR